MIWRRLAIVVSLIVALGVTVYFVPLSALRTPLEAAASRALDRPVTIRGSLHFALYPELGLALRDVGIANIAGGKAAEMVSVAKVMVIADLPALLRGHLQVTRVVLKEPEISLEIDRDGTANWQSLAAVVAQDPAAFVNLDIERVKIEDGRISYADARSGKTEALTDVAVSLTAPPAGAAGHPLSLEGSATYRAVPVKIVAALNDLPQFITRARSTAEISLASSLFDAHFDGQLEAPGIVNGKLKLEAHSLRGLASWAGETLPPGDGLGAITIDAAVAAKGSVYALTGAAISIDGMKLTGDLAIDTNPAVPALKGTLSVDHINLAPYLMSGASPAATSSATGDTSLGARGLQAFDGNFNLTVGAIALPGLRLDRASLLAVLHAGVLTATFNSLAAYGGTGKGTLTLDTTGQQPTLHNVLDMSGVRIEQFLGPLAGAPRVAAAGAVHLDVTSRGLSEPDILRSLSGRASLALGSGTISGVDLGAIAKLVQTTAGVLGGAVGGGAVTDFRSLSASFAIQDGVARTTDLKMVGPKLEMTGAGTVNLATHQLDFRLNPNANLGVAGIRLVDLGIPFTVTGTWDSPTFAPDVSALPQGIAGSVTGTATNVLSVPGRVLSAPGDALKSLLGK